MTSIELRTALHQGYKITLCYRIWKYTEFDNLFKDYVQTFMKMKIESSGFPSDIQTDEQRMQWALGIINLMKNKPMNFYRIQRSKNIP